MWQSVQVPNRAARLVRHVHQQCSVRAQELKGRAIVKVSGVDAGPFLQGLMTNDIKHLDEENSPNMYSMFLNTQGRILFDAIIYPWSGSYLVECDAESSQPLAKHLSMFKVRRKVKITVEDSLKPWVLFDQPPEDLNGEAIVIARDPRVIKELGWRVVIDAKKNLSQIVKNLSVESVDRYTELRYQLGVGEGSRDMPPGTCFPLECNCDYLHGVSFHKGCYLGQELTARTYHTGVIRKRLMPLIFQHPCDSLRTDATITDETEKRVGKLRGFIQGSLYGLGLLRIQQALSCSQLKINSNPVKTHRPTWWPIEAPKDRAQLESSSS